VDEISGEGNSLDFEARIMDTRIGRWLSLDPLAGKQPHISPYNAFNGNPIYYIDPTGKIVKPTGTEGASAFELSLSRAANGATGSTLYKIFDINEDAVEKSHTYRNNSPTMTIKEFQEHAKLKDSKGKTTGVNLKGKSLKKAYNLYLAINNAKTVEVMVLTAPTINDQTYSGSKSVEKGTAIDPALVGYDVLNTNPKVGTILGYIEDGLNTVQKNNNPDKNTNMEMIFGKGSEEMQSIFVPKGASNNESDMGGITGTIVINGGGGKTPRKTADQKADMVEAGVLKTLKIDTTP
jgi:RHS repeat-associated protein